MASSVIYPPVLTLLLSPLWPRFPLSHPGSVPPAAQPQPSHSSSTGPAGLSPVGGTGLMPFPQALDRLLTLSNFSSDFPSEATLTYFKLSFRPPQSPYLFMLVCSHSTVPGLPHSAVIMLQISLFILLIVHRSQAKVLNFERMGCFCSAPCCAQCLEQHITHCRHSWVICWMNSNHGCDLEQDIFFYNIFCFLLSLCVTLKNIQRLQSHLSLYFFFFFFKTCQHLQLFICVNNVFKMLYNSN